MAQEPNRTGTGNPNRRNCFFPETERGTGTVGTAFQVPKQEPEPSVSVKTVLKRENPFQRGTAGTENRNRSNRPVHEPHPNRTGATL